MVEYNDVIYIVPGDGCCGPNAAAAFLFHDEVFGPMLRKKMNLHMVKFWDKKYHNLTQCSPGHPFERRLGNKIVRFMNPEALRNFLQTDEAVYVWTDSEDLAVLSDIYQIKIKIITSKGKEDKNPTVNWIYPDRDMEEFAELKNVDLDTMVLYHENDSHFNLVINRTNELATLGSISTRLDVGSTENDEKVEKAVNEEDVEAEIQKLRKEIKICKQNENTIKTKYEECIRELKNKTEEAEKLRVEVNDLRMIIELTEKLDQQKSDCVTKDKGALEKHIDMKHTKDDNHELKISALSQKSQTPSPSSLKEIKFLKCDECIFETTSNSSLEEHVSLKHIQPRSNVTEDEFNCKSCDFQTTSEHHLKKHFTLKHTLKVLKPDEEIRCRNCGETFLWKNNLMKHRKVSHANFVANCKNYQEEKCPFSSEKCWWNHNLKLELENKAAAVVCYVCDEKFESKSELMFHRKNKHEERVRACIRFLEKNCRLQDSFCWFLHKEVAMETDSYEDKNKNDKKDIIEEDNLVFRNVLGIKEPPIMETKSKEKKE